MTVPRGPHRVGRVVAVTVAGTILGIGGTVAFAAVRPTSLAPEHRNPQFAPLIEWANAQHLTGLSPASLGPPRTVVGPAHPLGAPATGIPCDELVYTRC